MSQAPRPDKTSFSVGSIVFVLVWFEEEITSDFSSFDSPGDDIILLSQPGSHVSLVEF